MEPMQLATGTVVGGKVVVDRDPLPEGCVAPMLARDADETFEVPPELEAELLESIAQANAGAAVKPVGVLILATFRVQTSTLSISHPLRVLNTTLTRCSRAATFAQ